jgi:hypothetical protein
MIERTLFILGGFRIHKIAGVFLAGQDFTHQPRPSLQDGQTTDAHQ